MSRISIAAVLTVTLSGCAAFPTNTTSRVTESAWLALDAVDTAQTVQIVKTHGCFYENDPVARTIYGGGDPPEAKLIAINTALMVVHPLISRWIDEHAEDSPTWNAFRWVWRIGSLGYSAASVSNNFYRGITPTGTPRCY